MHDRAYILKQLVVGDIFHAVSANGAATPVCLVTAVTETTIQARAITTQQHFEFDRRTGATEWGDDKIPYSIESVSPLPVEIHNVLLGLDRKGRLERDVERYKLSEAEKKALLFIDSHYDSNRL